MANNENTKATKEIRAGADRKPFMIITDQNQFVEGSVLEGFAMKAAPGESQRLLTDPFQDAYGEKGLITPLYNPVHLMNLAEVNVYHDICCDVKASDVAGLGWDLEPIGDDPSPEEERVLREFFERVFMENPFKPAQRDKEELGYGGVELTREGDNPLGRPYNIYHVPAHTLRVHKSREKYCQTRGGDYHWFKAFGVPGNINPMNGEPLTPESLYNGTPASEMLWNVHYTSRSSYYGRPRVIPAIRAIYGHLSAMDFNIAFFQNYGVPAYAVFISGNYEDRPADPAKPDGETLLQAAVRKKFQQIQSNPHSTMVFSVPSMDDDGKVEIRFERLSVETKEGSFRLYRTDNRDEIITAHRVDPHRVGININGPLGGDTAKEARKNYKASVQEPEQMEWENLINFHIISSPNGFGFKTWRFRFVSFDLEDEKDELELVKGAFGVGAVTPNQVIRKYKDRFGLEESENPLMDCHYINGQPLEVQFPGAPLEGSEDPNLVVAKILDRFAEDMEEVEKQYADPKNEGQGNGQGGPGLFRSLKDILHGKGH